MFFGGNVSAVPGSANVVHGVGGRVGRQSKIFITGPVMRDVELNRKLFFVVLEWLLGPTSPHPATV